MNLKEKRAAKMAAAEAIAATAAEGGLTDEKSAELDALVAEIKELDEALAKADRDAALVKSLGSLGKTGDTEPRHDGDKPEQAKTIGEHFAKAFGEGAVERMKSGHKVRTTEFVKAATDTQFTPTGAYGVDSLTDIDLSIQREKRQRPVIADLLGKGTMNGTSIKYYLEGAFEGDFETVAEGGLKPQVHVEEPTPEEDAVKKIAAWMGFTDEILEDMPLWVSEINQRLIYKLAMKEEAQLLRGDGTGQNLNGILNRSGVQSIAKGAGTEEDVENVFKAQTLISLATDYVADAVIVNPYDYERFRLAKDGNKQYYGGGFFQGAYGTGGMLENPPIWGLRTLVSPVVGIGEAVVGNFSQAATMYRKGGVRVESTMSDGDDFIHNKVKTRVEERIALAVRQPAAFVKLAFSSAA